MAANDGLRVFSGIYGSAWRDGEMLHDALEFSGTIEVARTDVVLVGTTKSGYKPGREARDGTLRIQKRDTRWEMEVYNFLSQSLEQRRANRGQTLRPFSLILEYDDPDALGPERWQLDGCQLWRLSLGFSVADDLVEREYPITWESERPLEAFREGRDGSGLPVAVPYVL